LTKSQILGEEKKYTSLFLFPVLKLRPVYAGLITVLILFGLIGVSRNSLPGDPLYPIKKITEKSQAVFVSEEEKPAFQLKLANQRLEDLTKIPAKNLAPTINEFQANISQAAKSLAKMDATTSDPVVIKKIVAETKKLEKQKQKVESLGVVIEGEGTEEFSQALANMVGNLIEDLKTRTLTEEKEKILEEMEKLFEEGKYSEALEFYLINQ